MQTPYYSIMEFVITHFVSLCIDIWGKTGISGTTHIVMDCGAVDADIPGMVIGNEKDGGTISINLIFFDMCSQNC